MTLATPEPTVVPLYAGFWRRGAASLIDGILLFIPNIAVTFGMQGKPVLASLITIAISCLYFAGCHGSPMQATPGKKAFGIKVTGLEGERISYGRAIGRYFATWISSIILGIGYLMAAFTDRKRALHDMIAGTLVVNGKAEPEEVAAGGGTMPITGGVWAIIALLFFVPFVLGILAAIAIPAYQDYTIRAKVYEVIIATTPLRAEIQEAYAKKEPYKAGRREIASQNAESVEVDSSGEMVITFPQKLGGGGALVYTPKTDAAGAMTWRCYTRGMPEKYLPAVCRGGK